MNTSTDAAGDAMRKGTGNAEIDRLIAHVAIDGSTAAALVSAIAVLVKDAGDGRFYKWRLLEIIPLLEEARDALPAISLSSARLRGLSLTLGDRMDAAGTRTREEYDAAMAALESPQSGAHG